jgi:hypothetical protein
MGRCALSFRHWHGRDVLDRGRDVISHWLSVVSAIAWEGVIAGRCRAKARLCVFRGRAGAVLSCQTAHQRRGANDRGEHREIAKAPRDLAV